MRGCGLDSSGSRYELVAGNEPSGSINCAEPPDKLSDYQLLKNREKSCSMINRPQNLYLLLDPDPCH